ncbi:MAG: hypothetical protein DME25_06645 [Verrucomicrobia bacterium]|nr:MAG: hypothetical protein DME25_06645 [Verrucomicrobiota bacterium]
MVLLGACAVLFLALGRSAASPAAQHPSLIVVVGAPGEEQYGQLFGQWAELLAKAAREAEVNARLIGLTTNDAVGAREQLQQALSNEPKDGPEGLWLVFVGHGTFDGKEAKFNLRGSDVSATELAGWLQAFRRPLAVINTSSASAPFLNKLSASNRVIVTATRSGNEVNFARFGQYFCAAIADPEADLDKDGQTSLLEAFLMASRRVKEFYEREGRLVTEHALLDDNGDSLGTPPDWFRGIRAVKTAKDGAMLDGFRAHQFHLVRSEGELKLTPEVRARRDELELAIARLRENKGNLAEEDYYQKLEGLLLELARIYEGSGSVSP